MLHFINHIVASEQDLKQGYHSKERKDTENSSHEIEDNIKYNTGFIGG